MNKTKWGPGPWQTEPDRVEFRHAGLPCLLNRNQHGTWCGYAAVAPGHPLYGRPYDDLDIEVHGGLTYANQCAGEICHVPEPGEPDDVWWFGFDCSHAFDLTPALNELTKQSRSRETYRDLTYARRETERLAEQLAAIGVEENAGKD